MDLAKLLQATGFEWDDGNIDKNWVKHGVSPVACEQTFFNQPQVVAEDVLHSSHEDRLYALGQTSQGRLLFVVFTIRKGLIRVISARDMSAKERRAYRQHETE